MRALISATGLGLFAATSLAAMLTTTGATAQESGAATSTPRHRGMHNNLPAIKGGGRGSPIIAIFSEVGGPQLFAILEGREPVEDPRIVLAVWRDGHVIWSENEIFGGHPHFESDIDPARVESTLASLEQVGVFEPTAMDMSHTAPDYWFASIMIRDNGRVLTMETMREGVEQGKTGVAGAGGIASLNGRRLEDVLAEQPPEHLAFRKRWSEVERALLALRPDEWGEPNDGLRFAHHRYLVWRE